MVLGVPVFGSDDLKSQLLNVNGSVKQVVIASFLFVAGRDIFLKPLIFEHNVLIISHHRNNMLLPNVKCYTLIPRNFWRARNKNQLMKEYTFTVHCSLSFPKYHPIPHNHQLPCWLHISCLWPLPFTSPSFLVKETGYFFHYFLS